MRPGGECSAGGFYLDASFHFQGFVVGETGGVWGQAQAVPGLAALNQGWNAQVSSVSCARAGGRAAGGGNPVITPPYAVAAWPVR